MTKDGLEPDHEWGKEKDEPGKKTNISVFSVTFLLYSTLQTLLLKVKGRTSATVETPPFF